MTTREPFMVKIPRAVVEEGDTDGVMQGLSVMINSSSIAPQAMGTLRLYFAGYDHDPRELWEIPEVRAFVAKLDEVYPYWFFLADLSSNTLSVVTSCLCKSVQVRPGLTSLDNESVMRFMLRQYDGLNRLFERLGLPEALNVERSKAVDDYFAGRRVLN